MKPEIERARELRRMMSEPEVILWSRLKQFRARGFQIRRQFPFHGYFLDFVCLSRRVVIEVDGAQHGDDAQVEHDAVRASILARKGFRILRFWAGAVRRDVDAVMDQIVLALEATPSTRANGQPVDVASSRDLPTLTASRSVPPH